MSLNELLFKGDDGLESCYDRPSIEIAWDQWSRTRIRCKHGVFEGISDFMDLEQGVERAMKSFRASLATGIHNVCWQDCAPPLTWQVGDDDTAEYWRNNITECELIRDHDGEHRAFDDDDEDTYWAEHRVYYINGVDVTGKREFPKGRP
jgi:hypothetical protein